MYCNKKAYAVVDMQEPSALDYFSSVVLLCLHNL